MLKLLDLIRGAQADIFWPVQARSEEPSLAEWQTEINKQQRELVAMQAALPSFVNLGLTALHLGKVYIHTPRAEARSAFTGCAGLSWLTGHLASIQIVHVCLWPQSL